METDREELEDILPLGIHHLKVEPTPEFENGKPIKGTHKHGTTKYGAWHLWNTTINGKRYSLFSNEMDKDLFDKREIDLQISIKAGKKVKQAIRIDDQASWKAIEDRHNASGSTQTSKVEKDAVEDIRSFPEHFYAQDGDSVSERIIRGMAGNQAANLLSAWAKDQDNTEIVKRHYLLMLALYHAEKTWYSNR